MINPGYYIPNVGNFAVELNLNQWVARAILLDIDTPLTDLSNDNTDARHAIADWVACNKQKFASGTE